MTNIILLAVCFLAGIGLRRTGRFPDNTPAVLNGYVIYLALPALALLQVHRIQIEPTLLLTALMAWLVFAAAWLFFRFFGKFTGLPPNPSLVTLMLGIGIPLPFSTLPVWCWLLQRV